MKNLLILNTNFPPSMTIGTQRILRIAKYLDDTKWKIFVLTLKEKYYRGNGKLESGLLTKIKVYRIHKLDPIQYLINFRNKLFRARISNSISIDNTSKHRELVNESFAKKTVRMIKDFFTDLFEFPDSDISLLPFAIIKGYFIITRNKIDVIYSSSPPHSLHLSAAILKTLTKTKLVIDFRDPWARSPWHDEVRSSSTFEHLKHNIIRSLEKYVVRKADQVVFVTEQMRDDFETHYSNLPSEKFKVFFNGYDPKRLKKFYNLKNYPSTNESKITFVHTGTLYKRRNPSPLFFAIKTLVENELVIRDRIEFRFIGTIARELSGVIKQIHELKINDIIVFSPPVRYEESFEYMRNADVLVLLQPHTKLQIPGKFYDYICFDKPILAIAEKNSAVESVVKKGFGYFVNINDQKDIQKGILTFVKNPSFSSEIIRRNRSQFDISKTIREFDLILDC